MEEEFTELRGEDSRQSLISKHHKHDLVAPSIPQHLVASLHGFDGDYSQFANFPWDPMVCYMLDAPSDVRPPATFIEHGMTTDYFGTFTRSNGYNDMGGVVACSGGIFISQQDNLSTYSSYSNDDNINEPRSYNQSMEAFNMYLAPVMDRPNIKPSVAVIYSSYRGDFWLISSIKKSWGIGFAGESSWTLPKGWGVVGNRTADGYAGWMDVVIEKNFSVELTAGAQYLKKIQTLSDIPKYPLVHVQSDWRSKKAFRIAIVTSPGDYEEHSNFGVYDVEKSSDNPENANAFDTSRQARGLFTTGSQGYPTDFETIENVSDEKIYDLINQVKNYHLGFTMKPSIGVFENLFIMSCDGFTVEVIGTTKIADDIRGIISNPDSGYSHFAGLEGHNFDPVEYMAGSSSYWIVDVEEYSQEALEEAKMRISLEPGAS
jgi:hypothetical protein